MKLLSGFSLMKERLRNYQPGVLQLQSRLAPSQTVRSGAAGA